MGRKIAMKEKKIFLLLTDTGTMLTRLIKAYTKMPYNHASIGFCSELGEVYSFGRKTVHNPFIGGFVKEDIHSILFQQADCALYSLTVTDYQIEKMRNYIQVMEKQKETYSYNFIGLFGVILKKPIKRTRAFFCSQFIATVLKESKIMDSEKDFSLIKPSDLPHLADFQLVFEGRLKDYQNRVMKERISHNCHIIPVEIGASWTDTI